MAQVYELEYQAARGGFFSGVSQAQASRLALDRTQARMKDLLATLSLSFGANLQATSALEAELLREVVRKIGEAGFGGLPQPLPPPPSVAQPPLSQWPGLTTGGNP
jgi:hypothetical protein